MEGEERRGEERNKIAAWNAHNTLTENSKNKSFYPFHIDILQPIFKLRRGNISFGGVGEGGYRI